MKQTHPTNGNTIKSKQAISMTFKLLLLIHESAHLELYIRYQ